MTFGPTPHSNEPDRDLNEGLRLVQAFRRINDPPDRRRLLELAEQLASGSADKIMPKASES